MRERKRKRKSESESVCDKVSVWVCERLCLRETETECVCVRERGVDVRERDEERVWV